MLTKYYQMATAAEVPKRQSVANPQANKFIHQDPFLRVFLYPPQTQGVWATHFSKSMFKTILGHPNL